MTILKYPDLSFSDTLRIEKVIAVLGRVKQKGKKVLDVGCGEALILSKLRDIQAHGIDISKPALKVAHHKIQNGSFVVASAEKMPYIDECFDVVICTEVLEHLSNQNAAITEIARVVQKGGLIVFTIPVASLFKILLFRGLRRNPYFLSKEHLREYSLFKIHPYTQLSSLISLLRSANIAIQSVEGIYMCAVLLDDINRVDKRLNRITRSLRAKLFLIDHMLGKFPFIKYFGRYLLLVCIKERS